VSLHCVCGNVLEKRPFRAVISPCRCATPGPGRSTAARESFLDHISERQYRERTRLGLPVVTEIEKSHFRDEKRHLKG